MAVDVAGLVGVIVFYLIILVIGLLAGRKFGKSNTANTQFLANRDLGIFVASFTLSATMVGGAYINGTAEVVGRDGVVWTVAPVSYNVGILIASVLIAPKVRRAGYTTIFDPLQDRFGKKMGALLFFNEFFANLFWEAAILGALGSTLSIILDLSMDISVIVSACVAISYTFFGGLYSVAYTDVIQLIFITFGLILCLPFIFTNEAVDLSRIEGKWFGELPTSMIGIYIDTIFLCICGGMPWQAYYQRVLACKTPSLARTSSILGTLMSVLLLIPPSLIGIAGKAADWNMTQYNGNSTLSSSDWVSILPLSLQYLCPTAISVIGVGAVCAAVMSSADSLVLATASVFARNIYHIVFRPQASEREVVWINRISIVAVGVAGTAIALTVKSVFGLFVLCGDLMYVAHFPQVMCALWFTKGNTYGSLCGFVIGLLLRCLGGEPTIKLPVILRYPMYDEATATQLFPFKTVAMLATLTSIICVSYFTDFIFRRGIIPRKFDFFNCFPEDIANKKEEMMARYGEPNGETVPEKTKFLLPDRESNI